MRHLDRLPEPDILRKKGPQWLTAFIASGKERPDNSKYGHKSIIEVLKRMSHTKCFYCENSLKDGGEEVDHHIEVSVDKNGAFKWDNLYLCCSECNRHKIAHDLTPVGDALDPLVDTDDEIKNHIYYEEECIFERNASIKGHKTIEKYNLDSNLQDNRRRKQLQKLYTTIMECLDKGGRKGLTEDDKEAIRRYTYTSSPYSYMCECFIRKRYPEVFVNVQ